VAVAISYSSFLWSLVLKFFEEIFEETFEPVRTLEVHSADWWQSNIQTNGIFDRA